MSASERTTNSQLTNERRSRIAGLSHRGRRGEQSGGGELISAACLKWQTYFIVCLLSC